MLRSDSIWMRLVIGLVGASILAIVVAGSVLYFRFETTHQAFREETLQSEGHLIARLVRRAESSVSLKKTVDQILHAQQSNGVYTISNATGRLISASPGQSGPLWGIDESRKEEFFVRTGPSDAPPLYGITVKSEYRGKPAFVQLAFNDPEIFYDSVLAEFLRDIAWIWIPFVIGLVFINLFIVKNALRPLDRVVAQAESIHPQHSAQLLDEVGLPREVRTLVVSMNSAIRRMRRALDTQSNFIADASHELRTPVSVLKAHVSILPNTADAVGIRQEVDALARLVEQLLDSARLDAIGDQPDEIIDLGELSREVARLLAPSAILRGRKIEVFAPPYAVCLAGQREFLFRALRNVVENALNHAPPHTSVRLNITDAPSSITVLDSGPGIPPDMRDRIFDKFWQGGRDRSTGGAGLGMDIVRRTMEAMQGRIVIDDAAGGGASVKLQFPSRRDRFSARPATLHAGIPTTSADCPTLQGPARQANLDGRNAHAD